MPNAFEFDQSSPATSQLMKALSASGLDIADQLLVLCRCVVKSGAQTRALAELHRCRFERALERAALAVSPTFVDVANVALTDMISRTGRRAGAPLCCVSTALRKQYLKVMPLLPEFALICVLGGGHEHNMFSSVYGITQTLFYDTEFDKWWPGPALPEGRIDTAVVVFNRQLHAVGGRRPENWTNAVETLTLDGANSRWVSKPSLNVQRWEHCLVELTGVIYIIGGISLISERVRPRLPEHISSTVSTVEVFDPRSNTWTEVAPMSEPRSEAAAVVYRGRVYVVGGSPVIHQPTALLERYDPATGKWTRLADLPVPRRALAAVVLGDKLFALGGIDGNFELSASVDCYDFDTDSWGRCADMTIGRRNFAAVGTARCIYAIGGYARVPPSLESPWVDVSEFPVPNVERYDLDIDAWTLVAPLPQPRMHHAAAVVACSSSSSHPEPNVATAAVPSASASADQTLPKRRRRCKGPA